MNSQYDVIVIGDSKHGNKALQLLATANKTLKMAFISHTFKKTTTHDFINVEYIKAEVSLVDYKNRLFGCYLDNGARLYCTHLIIATGLLYEPLLLNNKKVPNVYNNTDEIDKFAKHQQAVVFASCDADVKFAIQIAKKYKYVYFCVNSLTPNITEKNMKKLASVENLVILPNANMVKFSTKENTLSTIELDTYANLTCSAIFIKTKAVPEVFFIPDNIISRDENGYLLTSKSLESILVPKCYAVGNCVRKNTEKMASAMIEAMLKDFGGKYND
jgi:thioredoxin reductase